MAEEITMTGEQSGQESQRLPEELPDRQETRCRDPLTGAYDQLFYEEVYRSRILTAGVAVLMLDDLELFHTVYGHYAQDGMLETAGNIIRDGMEETDLLFRLESNELVLVMPRLGQDRLDAKLEQLRLQLYGAAVPGYSRIRMTVSIGGVWVQNTELQSAVERAGRLMNCARMQKNTVITVPQPEPETDRQQCRRQSVLIVDDSPLNRSMLRRMLGSGFDTAEASSGEECLRLLEQNPRGISIILLDIHMEGIDGFAVLEAMEQRHLLEEIPVIMISSEGGADAMRRAFDLGALDYISRPFDAGVVYRRVSNTIRLYAKQRSLSAMAAQLSYEKEKNSRMMIGILSQLVEKRNGESRSHVRRVSRLTEMMLTHLTRMTDRYQLSQETRQLIGAAAALHDIGKMGIREELLNKHEPLTEEERQTLQSHTVLGAKMLDELEEYQDERFMRMAYGICRWHHERWDGSGYPDHLKGDRIPIAAQVVGLADVYERLVSKPVDGHTRTHLQAVRAICSGSCGSFSPLLLECLQDIEEEIEAAMQEPDDRL